MNEKVKKLMAAKEAALARWQESVTARSARQAQIEALERRRSEAHFLGQERALLPGANDAGVATATAEVEDASEETARLEGEERRARAQYDEAMAALDAEVRRLIPRQVEVGDRAEGEALDALGRLGRSALNEYLKAVGAIAAGRTARAE